MQVHLIDGTYELFRHFYALPSRLDSDGNESAAVMGVVSSVVSMLANGATHIGVATDHVVESFRNDMYDGYKTGDGMDPELWEQFHPLEDALRALGVVVWPMVEQEADDGLAAAAVKASSHADVSQVLICTPDKDLAQCVRGDSIVQLDRRRGITRNEHGIMEKFGVLPKSIPDYLGLTGDAADGFPGIPKWGAKSASTVLARYVCLEEIPKTETQWDVTVRGAAGLSASLQEHWSDALLFRDIATLRTDAQVFDDIDELLWRGPADGFAAFCQRLNAPELLEKVSQLDP